MCFISFVFCLFIVPLTFAQNSSDQPNSAQRKKITLVEWVEMLETSNDSIIELENLEIIRTFKERESRYWVKENDDYPGGLKFNCTAEVTMTNCVLPGFIDFIDCQWNKMSFHECTINGSFRMKDTKVEQWFNFHNVNKQFHSILKADGCTFQGVFGVGGFDGLRLSNCQFTVHNSDLQNLIIAQTFGFVPKEIFLEGKYFLYHIHLSRQSLDEVLIDNCSFHSYLPNSILSIGLNASTIKDFAVTRCKSLSIDLVNATIRNKFSIDSSMIDGYLLLNNVNFPGVKTSLPWKTINESKIGLRPEYYTNFKIPYTGAKNELQDETSFNNLISEYNNLYKIYTDRRETQSANGCYIRMKDLETARFKYLYTTNKSLSSWFNWRFNQFLKYFCDYGTSPVLALIRSIYIVLIFSLFYFFFYSDWDRIDRRFLIRKHNKLLLLFSSKKGMKLSNKKKYNDELKSYKDYLKKLKDNDVEAPYFIHLLGKPLYQVSIIRYRINKFIYDNIDPFDGKWKNYSPLKKIYKGILIGIVITSYLLFLVVVRMFNSAMLSLNAFSTLGFGKIPVKGISRYVVIVQGFLGWFLLSIFSVSLVNQLIQG